MVISHRIPRYQTNARDGKKSLLIHEILKNKMKETWFAISMLENNIGMNLI